MNANELRQPGPGKTRPETAASSTDATSNREAAPPTRKGSCARAPAARQPCFQACLQPPRPAVPCRRWQREASARSG